MKRRVLLLAVMAFLLAGCGQTETTGTETVSFYYLEKEYNFHQHESILAPENRDVSDHRGDLPYLLALYLVGPVEENHLSPLPAGTRIYCRETEGNTVTLELSEAARSLADADFSLACACLSLTCFDITDAQQVTIVNGDRSITMKPGSLLLVDDCTAYTETEETA